MYKKYENDVIVTNEGPLIYLGMCPFTNGHVLMKHASSVY